MNIPVSIEATNFLSFKHLYYDFCKGKTTLIQGRNYTDEGQKSNGSGKSAVQQMIDYAITGSSSRKTRDIKLINRDGETEATITFKLHNTRKNEDLTIIRKLFLKSSSTLQILLNGEDQGDKFPNVLEGGKWIEKYLGISKADFHNYFIPNEVNYVSFFNNSDTNKKLLVNRFTNASLVDGVEDVVQKGINPLNDEIVELERNSLKIVGSIETLQERLVEENNRDLDLELKVQIKCIEDQILELGRENTESSKEIDRVKILISNDEIEQSEIEINLDECSKRVSKTILEVGKLGATIDDNTQDRNDFTGEVNTLMKDNKPHEEKLKKYTFALANINNILAGVIACPECSYEFTLKADKTVKEYRTLKEKIDIVISSLNTNISQIDKKIDEVEAKIGNINSDNEKVQENRAKLEKTLRQVRNQVVDYSNDFENHTTDINNYNFEIKRIEQLTESNKTLIGNHVINIAKWKKDGLNNISTVNELNNDITTKKDELKEIEKQIEEISVKVQKEEEWKMNFILFKSYLANKKLKIIEGLVNKYLEQMKSDIQIKIEGFKKLANGTIKEKITPYIYRDNEIYEYGDFSKGERVRIDFATLLALQYLINESSDTGGLDLLFADEIAEGVDEEGLPNLLDSLSKSERTAFITSHTSVEGLYENIMMIEKRNRISEIV